MKACLTPLQSIPKPPSPKDSEFNRAMQIRRSSSLRYFDMSGREGRKKKTQMANTKEGTPSIWE